MNTWFLFNVLIFATFMGLILNGKFLYRLDKIIVSILQLTPRVQNEEESIHRTQFSMHKRERGLTLMIINVLHAIRSGPTLIEKY